VLSHLAFGSADKLVQSCVKLDAYFLGASKWPNARTKNVLC
jgi:hypothetical protein